MNTIIENQKRHMEDQIYEAGYQSSDEEIEAIGVKTQDEFLKQK